MPGAIEIDLRHEPEPGSERSRIEVADGLHPERLVVEHIRMVDDPLASVAAMRTVEIDPLANDLTVEDRRAVTLLGILLIQVELVDLYSVGKRSGKASALLPLELRALVARLGSPVVVFESLSHATIVFGHKTLPLRDATPSTGPMNPSSPVATSSPPHVGPPTSHSCGSPGPVLTRRHS